MNKHIRFVGLKPTPSLLHIIERQITRWINTFQNLHSLSHLSDYEVRIERDETYPYYQCQIIIDIGGRQWQSLETGRTLHETLAQALKNMKCIESIKPSQFPTNVSAHFPTPFRALTGPDLLF